MAKAVQQVSLWKSASSLPWGERRRYALYASFCAIGAWELAVTLDFALLTQHARENSLCPGGVLMMGRGPNVLWTLFGRQHIRKHS
jgi:hypothetical protein